MSRINRLEVENFKKISVVAMDIDGVTEISGENGAGKSTALDAISVLLDGMKVSPDEPIRHGQTKAVIRGRIGDMTVIRTITPKDDTHTSRIQFQPHGEKPYPATQTMVDDLVGEHHLDPFDFLKLREEDMFAALQAFVPNFDFAKSARQDAADLDERKEVNKDVRRYRAAADLIIVPDGTPTEPIDEQALVEQLQEAGDKNADREMRRANREAIAAQIANLRAESDSGAVAKKILAEAERLTQARDQTVARLQAQIDALQAQIANANRECDEAVAAAGDNGKAYAESAAKQADDLQTKLDEAGELAAVIDTVAISEQIRLARTKNADIARAVERAKHLKDAEDAEAKSKALDETLDARRKARETAIAGAKMPVKGLEFGDGHIRLHGSPWKQASTGQKLRAAFEYCVGCNPKLRLIWIRDASVLDDRAFAEVKRLAVEFDCTVLLETVRPIGDNCVVLEEGRVREVRKPALQESAA
jgi:AAA ATPase domain